MSVPSTHQAMARAMAFLFVPATRPERIAKALASGAGAVVVDLEDAVAPGEKAAARTALLAAVKALEPAQRARLLVRTNAAGTPWYSDDVAAVAACVALGLAGAMLAKAESAVVLAAVAQALGPQGLLVPLVESNAGLDALDALAQAPQVARLAFGHLDLQVDLGMECAADEAELLPVRLALVRASRRAGLAAPVDGVTTATDDLARLAEDTARSRRLGFGGKLCIHPAQVAPVQAAFAPQPQELAWARRVLEAAPAHGGAVFRLEGRMVDAPVLALAARVLLLAGQR
ncbi:CoA ester lyase [Acidovorax sp.]|uniref:HpcH/HpaI aldolase/citrate lyase family protein n=1 Tax=Acidovorax sp. TaxID=1872122 RepID=UPI002ACEB304|nr:CoA ester lyase [Acidovorax sp.]MDZ7863647.1 CoA ester lyase [Acidovorax sp.]